MKLFTLLITAVFSVSNALAETPQTLRVLCYNIHYGQGIDGRYNIQRLADVIKAAAVAAAVATAHCTRPLLPPLPSSWSLPPPLLRQPPSLSRQPLLLTFLPPPLAFVVAIAFAAAIAYLCHCHPSFLPSLFLPLSCCLGITFAICLCCHRC